MGKIKEKTRQVARTASHKTKRASIKTAKVAVKTARVGASSAKKVSQTKSYQRAHRSYKKAHRKIAETPHKHLMEQSPRYAAWHAWRLGRVHHGHIHGTLVIAWALLVISLVGVIVPSAAALSVWEQNDWTGGQGSNSSNQYSDADNIDPATSGQLTLAQTDNPFTNYSLDSNIDGWNGMGLSHDTSIKYSGNGAAKITAGGVSSTNFYAQLTNDGNLNQRRSAGGDFNGDGRDDLAVANYSANTISIYNGQANGTLASPTDVSTLANPYDIAVADFNQDGHSDMVVAYGPSTSMSVFINNGSGNFSRTDYSGTQNTCGVTTGRFNNDPYPDLAFMCQSTTAYKIYMNNGDGTFPASPTQYTAGPSTSIRVLAAVDINGDGYDDLTIGLQNQSTCQVYYSLSNGSAFENNITHTLNDCGTTTSNGASVGGGDFNGDGYGDIAIGRRTGTGGTSASQRNMMTILFGNADGSLNNQADYTANSGVQNEGILMTGDFNMDGKLDIAMVHQAQNIPIYLNNGDGTFAAKTDYSTSANVFWGTVLDTNGDGKPDIATTYNNASSSSGVTGIFINRTGGDAMTQVLNLGDTETYNFEAYAYTNGDAVTSADAELFINGVPIATTFSPTDTAGWYKLTAEVTGTDDLRSYGIVAKQGKVVIVDEVSLYRYHENGTLTSVIFDLGFGGDWGAVTFATSHISLTTVKVRTSNSPSMSGAPAFNGCPALTSGTDLTDQVCITNNDRYVQYQITLSADGDTRPTFTEIGIAYEPWDVNPPTVNASNILMKKEAGGDSVSSNGWTNGAQPYFEWTAGVDGEGESGIKGYCLYLGQDSTADPTTTKGLVGTSPLNSEGACQFAVSSTNVDLSNDGLIATALTTSNDPYYLNIRAFDNAGNVIGSNAQFQFRFDNTAPVNPFYVSSPSQFVANKEVTLTWPTSGGEAPSDANSGLAGLQYRIGADSSWYGDGEGGDGLLENDGSYTTREDPDFENIVDGNNVVYIRTWDNAGNVTSQYVTTVIKLNTSSPSSPQNVTATPSINTTNSFAFSWAVPNAFQGSANNITYCYTVNTTPTLNTCTYTAAGVTSIPEGAYATQPGENTFYVVAKDEAGNINYATAASTTFTADTAAPGIPLDLDIADVSIKTNSSWRLALSWNTPTDAGAGVASYRVFRSTDNNNFTQIASTAGTSYIDTGLSEVKYFYKVRACDSANNCGAFSSIVNLTPTGKFTSPATLTAQPAVSGVSTKKATIKWATNRTSDSKISLGTKPGEYAPFQVASAEQVTDHKIELNNLTPGTTYYAKASWTDVDGNTGSSSEFTFKTEPAPSTQEVQASRVTLSTAQITFTSVSAAKVVIQYGRSDSFGGVKEIQTSLSKSTYTVELNGLDDGSKYLYRLNTFDSEGNEYTGSTVLSFTTPARPRIENLRLQPVEGEPTSTQRITWTTNVPTSSLVRYNTAGGPGREVSDSALVTEHEITIKGLQDDTDYTFVAESRDKDGNLAVSDAQNLRTALDTRPPKISDVIVETAIRGTGAEARGQIVISWTTDEPATSQVGYSEGSTTSNFNNKTSEDTGLATEHVVIISDLPTSRVYSVQPISKDRSGNSGTGEAGTAIIGRASDNIITIVLNTLRKVFGF